MPQVSVAVEPVEVLDTVGAGDSYMGAFLVSLRAKAVLASVSFLRAHATSDNMEGGRSELRVRACLRLRHRMGWLR
jgi:sugar/nucleoside kinase (ribokinase family)